VNSHTGVDVGLLEFVRVYENIVPDDVCDLLVSVLDSAVKAETALYRDTEVMKFPEVNIGPVQPVAKVILKATDLYKEEFPEYTKFWPSKLGVEEMRVKSYTSGTGEQFKPHVDAISLESCKRYLVMLTYLNEGFTGGETYFYPDLKVKPQKGSVVVFPPTWQYPHAGLPVTSGTKYIMSSYLNFV